MKIKAFVFVLFIGLCFPLSAKPVYVVQIVNFHCPVCRSMDTLHEVIDKAAKDTGGRLIVAPFPQDTNNLWLERVYYAVRDNSDLESKVRATLFRGVQAFNLPLSDLDSVIEWLRMNIPVPDIDWSDIRAQALKDQSLVPLKKVSRIAKELNISQVPAFVLFDGTKFVHVNTFGPPDQQARTVIKKIETIANS